MRAQTATVTVDRRAVGISKHPDRTNRAVRAKPRPRSQAAARARKRATSERQRFSLFRLCFGTLVATYAAGIAALLWWGGAYYMTPLGERYFHPFDPILAPSGRVGLPLGIAGLTMMMLILLYPLRRRLRFLQRLGSQSQWLRVHMFLGLAGPVLVTFHTAGRIGGLVAVGFYSMWAVVASGLVGRYLYMKIPRTPVGSGMSRREIEQKLESGMECCRLFLSPRTFAELKRTLSRPKPRRRGLLRALGRMLRHDLALPFKAFRISRLLARDEALTSIERLRARRIAMLQLKTVEQLAVLDFSRRLFAHWHVLHRPFTALTFVVVFLHVAVVVLLGHGPKW